VVKHEPGTTQPANYFIERLAAAQGVPTSQLEYRFEVSFLKEILGGTQGQQVRVEATAFNFTGDYLYKGFSMAPALMPENVNFTLELLDDRRQLIQSLPVAKALRGDPPFVLHDQPMAATDDQGRLLAASSLKMSQIVFSYTATNRSKFDARARQVDDYLARLDQMASRERRLRGIRPTEPDSLRGYQSFLTNNQAFIAQVQTAAFLTGLGLENADPEGFLAKFEAFKQLHAQTSDQVNQAQALVHELYHEKGVRFLQARDLPSAQRQFNLALQSNANFAPSAHQLAEIDYLNGNFPQVIQRCEQVLERMNPDPETERLAANLVVRVIDQHVMNATQLNNGSRYDQAMAELDNALAICQRVDGITCGPGVMLQYERAARGTYGYLLATVGQATAAGNLRGAAQAIREAEAYQARFVDFIPDTRDIAPLAREVLLSHARLSEQAARQGDFPAATGHLEEAKQFQVAHMRYLPDQRDLAPATNTLFGAMLDKTGRLLDQGQMAACVSQVEATRGFMAQNGPAIAQPERFDQMVARVFMTQVAQARAKVEAGQLDQALELTQQADRFRQNYRETVGGDEELSGVRRLVYEAYIARGEASVARREFEKAVDELNKAQAICQDDYRITCGVELEEAFLKARVGLFEANVSKARLAAQQKRFGEADDWTAKAQRLETDHRLGRQPELDALVVELKRQEYDHLAAEGARLLQAGDAARALDLLNDALEIENRHAVAARGVASSPANVRQNRQSAAQKFALAEAAEGTRMAQANRLDVARGHLDKAISLSGQYQLGTDPPLARAIEDLTQAIMGQECKNQQGLYNQTLSQAQAQVERREFHDALRSFGKAIEQAKAIEYCSISSQDAVAGRDRVAPVVQYLDLRAEADRNVGAGRYAVALSTFDRAAQIHDQNQLGSWQLGHLSRFEFIQHNGNLAFVNFCLGQYIAQQKAEDAMSLMRTLQQKGFSKSASKDNQTELGYIMARREYQQNPSAEWSDRVEELTGDDGWYSHFKRAFKKQWKSY